VNEERKITVTPICC